MNQSNFIATVLLAGFILFLAANNRLTAYTAVLWGSPAAVPTPSPTSASGGTSGINPVPNYSPAQTSAIAKGYSPSSPQVAFPNISNVLTGVTKIFGFLGALGG